MKRTTILVLLAILTLTVTAKKPKNEPAKTSTVDIIHNVNAQWQATHSPEVNAFWDNAVYFTGNMEVYKLTGNAKYQEYSDKWARFNKWQGAKSKDKSRWKYKRYGEGQDYVLFGDWQNCFHTYMNLYETNPNDHKIERAKEVIDHTCNMTANDFWWWCDALYMAMPVYSRMYRLTGDSKYLDKLHANFMFADSLMFDKEENMYYRDAKYVFPKHKTEKSKKDFWARGEGWVLAGLAKVLEDMPATYKHYDIFRTRFAQVAQAVIKHQQKEGYWTRSIMDSKQAEGPETSGTALMAYGLMWGVNNNIIDKATYAPAIEKAWNYLTGTALQKDWTVGYVQPIGEKAIKGQMLTAKNVTNFGTGAFLLAACERVRYEVSATANESNNSVEVTIANPTPAYRQEVVELDAAKIFDRLNIPACRLFKVTGATGQEVPYQLTHDNKLLIDASVRPNGKAVFRISKGTPKTFVSSCYGRQYPERVDDIAWENDRGAYRCYGPALQRSGEKAYGNDVWLKNTPDLEVEKRYYIEDTNKQTIAALKKTDPQLAEALNMETSYHYDQGYGLDCYKVGPTLGCGTPAIIDNGEIIFPYCYKEYEILDNGPLRFSVKLTYNAARIKEDANVVETRILSLDKNSNFNKMTVVYDGLSKAVDIASGVVIHAEDTSSIALEKDYVMYADPTDNPEKQNFQIYVAALFPDGVDTTGKVMFKNVVNGNAGHALGIKKNYKNGEKFSYYFGSAWSKYDVKNLNEWKLRIEDHLYNLKNPMTADFQ